MNSNKKIVSTLLKNILLTKECRLSLQALEDNIEAILPALDSTFPKATRILIENLVVSVRNKQAKNEAAALNTLSESNYNETEGVEVIFDKVIQAIGVYLRGAPQITDF